MCFFFLLLIYDVDIPLSVCIIVQFLLLSVNTLKVLKPHSIQNMNYESYMDMSLVICRSKNDGQEFRNLIFLSSSVVKVAIETMASHSNV